VRVLVTGSTGQLGRALLESIPDDVQAVGLDRSQCDLGNPRQCRTVVLEQRPDVLINAAAFTQVDKAESEREMAFRINAEGPRILANAIAESGGRLIQISTDFVFNGRQKTPYAPDAVCDPLNVYGASKRAGEEFVLEGLGEKAVVLRTAWVYSSYGSNFVRTMLRLMASRDSVSVVSDQIGCPTWARSLANAVWAAVMRPAVGGILHWTDRGLISWHDFAVAIQEEGLARGLLTRAVPVRSITSEDYARQFPTTVPRPAYSALDVQSTCSRLGMIPVPWRTQLRAMLDELKP
jgi:dTDP-4-dehydrorhamnose reductase